MRKIFRFTFAIFSDNPKFKTVHAVLQIMHDMRLQWYKFCSLATKFMNVFY